ncbi:MarR family winged helix-turn-helix transcriptional regulator [Agromyces sp. SYSU T0242]|uniref:MarR family winged helix-turn-helix transcriptional regulator n=1 Tax=Agromyces litoreus TaxID=3158561 RepID=UPI003399FE84
MSGQPSPLDRILEIADLLERDLEHEFAGSSLSTARMRLLRRLARSGPSTQQALAARLQVSPRNVTGLVDALEAAGYVTRSPHPSDRRAVLVTLTDDAERLMHEMERDHAELTSVLLLAVDSADRAAFVRGMNAVAGRMRELAEAADAGRAAARRSSGRIAGA